jgi:hypothetical protein
MSSTSGHRLIRFSALGALLLAAAAAQAQTAPAPQGFVAPTPEPAAPAAPLAPTPTTDSAQPSTPAAAAPTTAPEATVAAEPEPDAGGKGKKHKKHKKHEREPGAARDLRDDRGDRDADVGTFTFGGIGGSLQIKGRVFALAELSHRRETVVSESGGLEERDRNALDLSLPSARIGFEYHSPLRWLSAELELDIAGKPTVKDAYVLAGKRFFFKAGQFKIPTSALALESPWTLPIVRRGFAHDLLSDWLDIGGRRPGFAVGYRGKGGLKPRITLGAFQGTTLKEVVPGDRNVDLIEAAALDAQSIAARAEISLFGVDVGAWYEHRAGGPVVSEFEHYETFGLDATLDQKFEHGGLRVWIDGHLGESFYVADDKPGDDSTPLFGMARALAAYRFGGVALGDPYVEPFGHFALLDPDLEVVSDFATELAVGVNAGFWDRARLSLQAEKTSGDRNLPKGFLDNQDPDRLSLLVQAGARF